MPIGKVNSELMQFEVKTDAPLHGFALLTLILIGEVNGGLMQFEAKIDAEVLGFALLDFDRQSQRWIDAVRS